jgi:hypothetical protein
MCTSGFVGAREIDALNGGESEGGWAPVSSGA